MIVSPPPTCKLVTICQISSLPREINHKLNSQGQSIIKQMNALKPIPFIKVLSWDSELPLSMLLRMLPASRLCTYPRKST